jgi:hypothetical protein
MLLKNHIIILRGYHIKESCDVDFKLFGGNNPAPMRCTDVDIKYSFT